ncbi:MAG: hypothetical protein IJM31_00625, partial [Campylobacter sp.]|nr:hypothetical protein [Campylobacter sp.]
ENLEFVVVEICKFVSICHCEKCEAFRGKTSEAVRRSRRFLAKRSEAEQSSNAERCFEFCNFWIASFCFAKLAMTKNNLI